MSSSDSEDENLVSAIDHDFVNKILTQAACSRENILPSRRTKVANNDKNELKVSPGFQKHVAKRLEAIIQRNLKEVTKECLGSGASAKELDGGIRLFSHSKCILTKRDLDASFQETMKSPKGRQKRGTKKASSDKEDEHLRLSSVAVSPEWVLQKKGAFGKCEKGKVIRLKDHGDGKLVEITPCD